MSAVLQLRGHRGCLADRARWQAQILLGLGRWDVLTPAERGLIAETLFDLANEVDPPDAKPPHTVGDWPRPSAPPPTPQTDPARTNSSTAPTSQ